MKPKASPTFLHLGASYADEEKVLLHLASNGRAAFNRDANGWLPLHVAARAASVTIVKKLISQNPRAAETADKAGWLPLHYAACSSSSLPVSSRNGCESRRDPCRDQGLAPSTRYPVEATTLPSRTRPSRQAGALPLHCAAFGNDCMPVCKALLSACPEAASKACPVASAKGTKIKGKRTVAALAAEVNV